MTSSHVSTLLDSALTDPVLVVGSIPPAGRDLDLLVPRSVSRKVGDVLVELGFVRRGGSFVRFGDLTAYEVELVCVEDWRLTEAGAQALFGEARPIAGYEKLLHPAPHHSLLIYARRLSRGMVLDHSKRARLAAWLEEDPSAWEKAESEAPSWDCTSGLTELHVVFEGGRDEVHPSSSDGGEPSAARAVKALRRKLRGRGGAVVSLSGLDGSGKSTQAEHLHAALTALGIATEIEWTKIARDPALRLIARPVKAIIRFLPSRSTPVEESEDDPEAHLRRHPDGPKPPPDAGALFRRRSRALTYAWTCVVAFANASTHRRTVRRHLRGGKVVICDRYVLDSRVHLRHRYGFDRGFRLQKGVIRWFSPRPLRAFFLDVAPETARARKPEQYTTLDLQRLRELYLQEAQQLGARRVNASAPIEYAAAVLAEDVWTALGPHR